MAKHNGANARIKREYFTYLKEAQRRDEASIDAVAKALARFEEANGHKDFKTFHRAQAVAFKHKLDHVTTANIQSASHFVNTNGKYLGRQAFDTTTNKIYFALGALTTSSWRPTDGSADLTVS